MHTADDASPRVRTTERAVPLDAAPDGRRLGALSGRTAPDPQTGRGESCRAGPAGQTGCDWHNVASAEQMNSQFGGRLNLNIRVDAAVSRNLAERARPHPCRCYVLLSAGPRCCLTQGGRCSPAIGAHWTNWCGRHCSRGQHPGPTLCCLHSRAAASLSAAHMPQQSPVADGNDPWAGTRRQSCCFSSCEWLLSATRPVRCPCSSPKLRCRGLHTVCGTLHSQCSELGRGQLPCLCSKGSSYGGLGESREGCAAAPPLLYGRRRVRPPRRGGTRRGRDGDVIRIQVRHRA